MVTAKKQPSKGSPLPTIVKRHVDAYHWVDLYAGTYVAKGDVDLGPLFKDVLSPFDPFVVVGPRPRGA